MKLTEGVCAVGSRALNPREHVCRSVLTSGSIGNVVRECGQLQSPSQDLVILHFSISTVVEHKGKGTLIRDDVKMTSA